MSDALPIEGVMPAVAAALATARSAVLVAEPGAGKTTVVPWRLLEAPWLEGRKIVMLEPRRIAARAAAARIAWHLRERVGETVGYRVRFDTRISARTRIEVVTEGVLTRILQDDPSLEGYGLVILDEFHERSIAADLGLGLTLQTRAVLRPDLRVLVMSATIDAPAVARLLDGAPVIDAPGRVFPVETRYRPPRPDQRFEAQVAAVVREAVHAETGDVLVFLPGVGEIRRVEELLAAEPLDASILPLHGTLPAEAQDAALTPGDRRRVILATAIAETSLTVPGVRVVIDGGRIRTPRFSPRTGMTRLETVRVTRASADQRRGRAGRTEPGVCYRLWAAGEDAGLLAHRTPEILAADLAPLLLDLAAAGVRDPAELAWLDPPPPAALAQARELLLLLDAIDGSGRITPLGRRMAALALHPRLGHLAVRAAAAGQGALAAVLAAILSDRDPARRTHPHELPDVDLRLRVEGIETGRTPPGFELDRGARARLKDEVREWRRRLDVPAAERADAEQSGRLLAWAYPDRVAQRRGGQPGRFLLRNGRGAAVPPSQPLGQVDFLVVAEVEDSGAESRILLAAPLDLETLDELVRDHGEREASYEWDPGRRQVRAIERTRLGAIVLAERAVGAPDPERVRETALAAIRRDGIGSLPWSEAATRIRQRLAFLHRLDPGSWPDGSEAGLTASLETWLGPSLAGGSLDRVDLGAALLATLRHDRRAEFDRMAPDRWEVPTGSRLAIDYTDPAAPALAVRLQEMFGQTATPMIGGGRVPLTVQLLSPAGRPVQVTRDLAGFWRTSYFDVRKDLKGRYPKHEWPDNPLEATPTRRAKRRS
ncbi:MAG: ATP-dependent helicase HrpB [Gemmatimonadales bacterium]|nr:ATP-dependent helicase HrpB [Gemmatimonadales bacterium]